MDFENMTNEGLAHLGLSELHTCQSYYNRLFYALIEASELNQHPKTRAWASTFINQASIHTKKHWLNQSDIPDMDLIVTKTLTEGRDYARSLFSSMQSLTQASLFDDESYARLMALSLNFYFLHAKRLHQLVEELTPLKVDLPRVSLMDTIASDDGIPAYRVSEETIFDLNQDKDAPVRSLEGQREKKYEQLIHKGHKWVGDIEYDLARESFMRALNFKETSEAYNLIGWTYSLENKFEMAKKFCLKAIQIDPSYGAPYNDLGTYLLAEGEINESLKWFELAKNSRHYQNREYPYINAGRAYLNQREFKKALEEFSMAVTLAPFNEELHTTIQRIKDTLNKSELFKEDELPPPLF